MIQNGKVFEPAWTDPVGPNLAATKAILQADYRTRVKRVEKLHINLSMAYGLVIGSAWITCDRASKARRGGNIRQTSRICWN